MTDLAALLESVANAPKGSTPSSRPCKVTQLGLGDTVKTLTEQGAAGYTVSRVLHRLGHRVSQSTIRFHVRGECGCRRD